MSKNKKLIPENIDDKLYTVKYNPDEKTHLHPKQDDCVTCIKKTCTFICPANVYTWDIESNRVLVGYENCLECGACRIACEKQSLSWSYPKSGYGVIFKQS